MDKKKENYQRELEIELKEIDKRGEKPSLLLHACCGPCSSYVLEYIASHFKVTVLYYNPNIYPKAEYDRRFNELKNLYKEFAPALENDVKVVEIPYIAEDFYNAVKTREEPDLAKEAEKGERCRRCYELRLKKTFEYAKENNYDYFCTTLSISPFKDAEKINQIGREIEWKAKANSLIESNISKVSDMAAGAEGLNINETEGKSNKVPKWLVSDFKKKGGFKRSLEISGEFSMYRQEYCGCVYSYRSREEWIKQKNRENAKNEIKEDN